MAAPNIVNVNSIVGITTLVTLPTTGATVVLNNPAGSNKVLKINNVIVANVNGSATANISLGVNNLAAGAGTSFRVAYQIDVAAKSSLVAIDKNASIYLEENRSIVATASAGNYLEVVCSYEEIS
jgi:hypothetical protein